MGSICSCFGLIRTKLNKDETEANNRESELCLHPFPPLLGADAENIIINRVSGSKVEAKTCYNLYGSEDDEDVCPTCLEEYSFENPRIVTKCEHNFHLACIYEWMERSQTCPLCFKVMEFTET